MTNQAEVLEVDLGHLRMSALAWGPERGRLVVCLHGFPDSAWSWRHLGPILGAQGLRVVAPFTRGYAPTSLPGDGDYHIGALMYDAAALCRSLGGQGSAVLIGHDWGSYTCNGLAAHPRSPFAAHISMSVPPIKGITPRRNTARLYVPLMARQLRMSWYIMFFQLPFLPERVMHRIIGRLWRDWSPELVDPADVHAALAALPTLRHRAAALAYYRCMVRNTRPLAVYADMHAYSKAMPRGRFLYLHGTRDGALHPGFVQILARALPEDGAPVMIEGAGHFIQIEQPAVVAGHILEFLAGDTAHPRPPGDQGQVG